MVFEYTSEICRYIPSIVKLDENGYYPSAKAGDAEYWGISFVCMYVRKLAALKCST
jgi:hypothetical protein